MSSSFAVLSALESCGAVTVSETPITFKSGVKRHLYYNVRQLYASGTGNVGVVYAQLAEYIGNECETTLVAGVPHGAVPIAAITAHVSSKPLRLATIRSAAKGDHGLQTAERITGAFVGGDKIVLIEDTVTSGGSVVDVGRAVQEAGLVIEAVVCVVARSGGAGLRRIESELGCKTHALWHAPIDALYVDRFFEPYAGKMRSQAAGLFQHRLLSAIHTKQSRVVFSADLPDPDDMLRCVKLVAPYICMVKTHWEIYAHDARYVDTVRKLRQLSHEYGFLVLADRKLCDIGNTVTHQCTANLLAEAADAVTVVPFDLKGTLAALPSNVPAFVVCEYSTQAALTKRHPEVIDTMLETALNAPNVVGIVAQTINKARAHDLMIATPGVHLEKKTDERDQSYRPPSAMSESTDLFIVGRGIYQADDPVSAVKAYRDAILT